MTDLVRSSVEDLVRRDDERRALSLSGRFRSGEGNLSAEHDRYLADAFGDSQSSGWGPFFADASLVAPPEFEPEDE
ncbi:MAG TPA: hypothetical protein VN783_13755 [Thermoanaerobaculia bacterium]|nr:hypothetical protein [Thermoanaerobaculia bacterium]